MNWTAEPEDVTLTLVKKEGGVSIITATERSAVPDYQVRTGEITTSVPARGVVLVEQI